MAQTIPVVNIDAAEEEAYEMGYDKFTGVAADVEGDFDLEHFRDSADYANNVLPSLRALAGHGDTGPGTYTVDREVAVIEYHQVEDLPAEGERAEAHHLLTELLEMWERGAYDAGEGREKYSGVDF